MARIGRPRTGEMPQRGIRMDDETWDRVGRAAEEEHTTRSAVIRRAVVEHLDRRDAGQGR